MKAVQASNALIKAPRGAAKKSTREGKARAERIIAMAEGGISGKIGKTDITDLTEEELVARYRRMMRG